MCFLLRLQWCFFVVDLSKFSSLGWLRVSDSLGLIQNQGPHSLLESNKLKLKNQQKRNLRQVTFSEYSEISIHEKLNGVSEFFTAQTCSPGTFSDKKKRTFVFPETHGLNSAVFFTDELFWLTLYTVSNPFCYY